MPCAEGAFLSNAAGVRVAILFIFTPSLTYHAYAVNQDYGTTSTHMTDCFTCALLQTPKPYLHADAPHSTPWTAIGIYKRK
jgi:hypothetical protein